VQRPLTGKIQIFSPYQVLTSPLTLEPKK